MCWIGSDLITDVFAEDYAWKKAFGDFLEALVRVFVNVGALYSVLICLFFS